MARKRKVPPAGESGKSRTTPQSAANTIGNEPVAVPQFLDGNGYLEERAAGDPRKESDETAAPLELGSEAKAGAAEALPPANVDTFPTSAAPPEAGRPATPQDTAGAVDEIRGDQLDKNLLRHEPYIGEQYNQTYLYGLAATSRSAYVFYEVGSGTRDHLKHTFGQNFFDNNYLVLRVRRTDTRQSWDVEDFMDSKNQYWIKVEPNVEYECELGYRAKGTKFFEHVANSNRFRSLPEVDTTHESQNEWREVSVESINKELPVEGADGWRFNLYESWKRRKANRHDENGYWALVLHMHLPFVRHIEYPVALEEQWLFEAITSCYAPLLRMFWNLERDKIDFRITVSISPPLMSMLCDPQLQDRYREFLKESIALADRELENNRGKTFQHTIETILGRLHSAREVFEAYSGNILHGFRDFQNMGKVEVMTAVGTHPILPYYNHMPEIARGHIQLACRQYEKIFGRWPRGMWLPENAFTPGIDYFLQKEGIKWTIVNSTGITRGNTRPWYGTYRPVITHNNLAVFGIDEDTRSQVWSREAGYPGNANYKEWYRDLGYDAAWEYVPEYFKTANVRRNTGLKYYRITGKNVSLHQKAPYNPEWAQQTAAEQAGQFVFHRGTQAHHQRHKFNIKPIAVSAYDAELFGHWWEEGPTWIEMVLRKLCCDQASVRPCTPSEFLAEQPRNQLLMPGASTWGKRATFETWVDGRNFRPNTWVYRHLFRIGDEMASLATERKGAEGIERRALNQAAREMMLAQASDWPFLISMDQSSRYAEERLIKHIDRAKELLRQVRTGDYNEHYLRTLESADTFLRETMDFRVFCRS